VSKEQVQIVRAGLDMDAVLRPWREAKFSVALTDMATFTPARRQPHREAPVIVVAALTRPRSSPAWASSTVGFAPNSPPQMTSVSSSMPSRLSP